MWLKSTPSLTQSNSGALKFQLLPSFFSMVSEIVCASEFYHVPRNLDLLISRVCLTLTAVSFSSLQATCA